jgi:hypothetical protein
MSRSILSRTRKKIGRPPTGAESVHLRILPDQAAAIEAWISKQREPGLTRPEAIRRLVELGLKAHAPEPKAVERLRERVAGAAELAAKAVDSLTVGAADADKKASRKRRLTKAKGK